MASFPGGTVVKNLPAMKETLETWDWSLGQEDSLQEELATHSSILAWEIPWTEELAGSSPWGHKESDTTWWLSTFIYTAMADDPIIWKTVNNFKPPDLVQPRVCLLTAIN